MPRRLAFVLAPILLAGLAAAAPAQASRTAPRSPASCVSVDMPGTAAKAGCTTNKRCRLPLY